MDWRTINWDTIERLRRNFIEGTAGAADYWRREDDLEAYDLTFGQRIAWKWQYVLGELKARGWSPPDGGLTDWGCGSGVAGREFLTCFGAESVTGLSLWDRSAMATRFAADKAREAFTRLNVRCQSGGDIAAGGTLLVSHTLGELSPQQADFLVSQAHRAGAIIWIEPGTHEASTALVAVRERLRSAFRLVAPCTHQAACGMLAPENARHWCHHFAPSSPQVHTDGDWVRFGRMAGIDLRSLPLSYLVLDGRAALPLPADAVRVIGRARMYRAYALLFGCDETGVREYRFMKRKDGEAFRLLKKDIMPSLQVWHRDGLEINELRPL